MLAFPFFVGLGLEDRHVPTFWLLPGYLGLIRTAISMLWGPEMYFTELEPFGVGASRVASIVGSSFRIVP